MKMMMVGLRIDTQEKAAYVSVSGGSVHHTKSLGEGVNVDFAKDGRLVGVESVDANMTLLQLQQILELHPDRVNHNPDQALRNLEK
jgi:uncharacterized protein YuzE